MDKEQNCILELNRLSVVYNDVAPPVTAVDDVSFDLKAGESLGLIGESGCGKSSLALSLMGLIKQGKVSGEIKFKGVDLTKLSKKALDDYRWKEIALVFQNSLEVLNPVLKIEEQIAEPLKHHFKYTHEEIENKTIKLLEMVGLDPKWRSFYPHQLSGGMRQRVLIAMALSCEPQLLLVDEPTTALDPISKNEILQLLKELQNKLNFSMIIISHDLGAVVKLTSRVITMYCGRIIEMGATDEVIKRPLHCYTRGLLNSSPTLYKYKDLWGITGEISHESSSESCAFYSRCCQRTDTCKNSRPVLNEVMSGRTVACHKGGIETFLIASNVAKNYKNKGKEVAALKNGSLEIRSGEIVALIGETGSGKSTLAHCIAGILPVDEGSILFKNNKVKGNNATSIFGGMQIVFQDPFSATSHRLTVLDVVKEPLDILKWGNEREREAKAAEALKTVQLPSNAEFYNRHCYALSGGQRQRVAIARALVTEPILLIADEVSSMLDPSTQANLLRNLKEIQNSRGFSMLYITHDLFLARKIADRIYIMHKGEIVESGASFEVMDKPKDEYSKRLLQEAFQQLL